MKKIVIMLMAGAIALGTSAAQPAMANAPLGFQLMCLKNMALCRAGGAKSIQLSDSAMATLVSVNRRVNNSISPQYDTGADTWNANVSVGDCEDYVMTKRVKLVAMGFPSSALRIAYVKTRRGEGHAVLVVKTNQGDLALDNLTSEIKLLENTGHRVVSISGANPLDWS